MEDKKTLTDIGFRIDVQGKTFVYLGLAIGVPLVIFAVVSYSLKRV